MNKYRRYLPIVAVLLAALGLNLDRFGIDLDALSRGQSPFSSQGTANSSGNSNSSNGQSASTGKSSSHSSGQKWSDTSPNINLWHVFEGEINRSGSPTGYHSRPGGQDAPNARIVRIQDRPNRQGVYTATIEVRDGNQWKSKFSTFFPDSLSRDEVIDIILHAYKNSKNKNEAPWEGPSGAGYQIRGYTSGKGGINTAFPVYVK